MYYNGKLLCGYINILLCEYYKYTPRKWGKGKNVNDKKIGKMVALSYQWLF